MQYYDVKRSIPITAIDISTLKFFLIDSWVVGTASRTV